jgi:hypothetical protein
VKFRRKAQSDPAADDAVGTEDEAQAPETGPDRYDGPYDSDELPPAGDDQRIDLGSLLITAEPNRELRMQVDEASGFVQAVQLVGPDGALELRAFAAPRGGDLWGEVRPQIAAEVAQQGGTATERQGPWGTELICQIGQRGGAQQLTRIIGVNGPRWMLRASLLGAPAARPDDATDWEDSLRRVGVHRGAHALPVGEALPVVMPPQARPVGQG